MSPDVLLTAAVTLLTLLALATPRMGPDLIFVPTVAVLYVVVAALRETGGVHWIGRHLLGRGGSNRPGALRLRNADDPALVRGVAVLMPSTDPPPTTASAKDPCP